MPSPLVPVTAPDAVIARAPLPLFFALMPNVPPETDAAEMVRDVPVLEALMPAPLVPVTAPVAVIASAPEP